MEFEKMEIDCSALLDGFFSGEEIPMIDVSDGVDRSNLGQGGLERTVESAFQGVVVVDHKVKKGIEGYVEKHEWWLNRNPPWKVNFSVMSTKLLLQIAFEFGAYRRASESSRCLSNCDRTNARFQFFLRISRMRNGCAMLRSIWNSSKIARIYTRNIPKMMPRLWC